MRNRILWMGQCLILPILLFGMTFAAQAQTYKFSTLYSFKNNGKDPSTPSSLILSSDGNLYGTSASGGTHGAGTVFKMTTKGALTVLHSFNGDTEGTAPSSVARDIRQGNIYGTTTSTVFKMVAGKGGTYTLSTLYSGTIVGGFQSATLDSSSNLYGIAQTCTTHPVNPCLFEIPNGGEWEIIYSFVSGDPYSLLGNILINNSGDLYVSAAYGGTDFYGYVLEIGSGVQVGPPDFSFPDSLRQDAAGDIYGLATEYADSTPPVYGSVWETTVDGVSSTLYSFTDGSSPVGSFSIDKSGNVYGTVFGTAWSVFKVTPGGVLTTIYAGSVNAGIVMDIGRKPVRNDQCRCKRTGIGLQAHAP